MLIKKIKTIQKLTMFELGCACNFLTKKEYALIDKLNKIKLLFFVHLFVVVAVAAPWGGGEGACEHHDACDNTVATQRGRQCCGHSHAGRTLPCVTTSQEQESSPAP